MPENEKKITFYTGLTGIIEGIPSLLFRKFPFQTRFHYRQVFTFTGYAL